MLGKHPRVKNVRGEKAASKTTRAKEVKVANVIGKKVSGIDSDHSQKDVIVIY